jgi:hypothetical protein
VNLRRRPKEPTGSLTKEQADRLAEQIAFNVLETVADPEKGFTDLKSCVRRDIHSWAGV